jgi:hypothetical protein
MLMVKDVYWASSFFKGRNNGSHCHNTGGNWRYSCLGTLGNDYIPSPGMDITILSWRADMLEDAIAYAGQPGVESAVLWTSID